MVKKKGFASELNSLVENETSSIKELHVGKKTLKTRWDFKIKRDSDNQPVRFIARLDLNLVYTKSTDKSIE